MYTHAYSQYVTQGTTVRLIWFEKKVGKVRLEWCLLEIRTRCCGPSFLSDFGLFQRVGYEWLPSDRVRNVFSSSWNPINWLTLLFFMFALFNIFISLFIYSLIYLINLLGLIRYLFILMSISLINLFIYLSIYLFDYRCS